MLHNVAMPTRNDALSLTVAGVANTTVVDVVPVVVACVVIAFVVTGTGTGVGADVGDDVKPRPESVNAAHCATLDTVALPHLLAPLTQNEKP